MRFSHAVIWEDIRAFVSKQGMDWSRLSGKTVLIAGANGFLPSYMADTIAVLNDDKMLAAQCKLIALTHKKIGPKDRLGHLIGRKDVKFIEADVTKQFTIPAGVDFIVHGASPASPRDYLARPIETMDANVTGLRTMLDYSVREKCESILYISSGAIYGDVPPDKIPTKEDFPGLTALDSERACYNESKRYAETLAFQFHKTHGVPVKIVRPFHHYGPGQRLDDGRVLADFLSDALAGRPIKVKSTGDTLMTFNYAGDAAEMFWRALLSEQNGQAFNVGSGGPEYTVRQLADEVAELFTPRARVQMEPQAMASYQKEAPKRSLADISKAKKMLGWEPHTPLHEGLKRTLRWHSAQKK